MKRRADSRALPDPEEMDEPGLTILMVSAVSDLRGGAERSLVDLARALRGRGHALALAAWRDGELASAFEAIGGEIHLLGAATDPASPLGGITSRVPALAPAVRLSNRMRLGLRSTRREERWLAECVGSTGADVIHTNCDLSPRPVRGAAEAAGVPWVAHLRDHWRSWFHPRTARALRSADAVIATSAFLAERARSHGIESSVIPNPVAGEELRRTLDEGERAGIRREMGIGPDVFAVAVVGRLDEQKGSLRIVPVARALVPGMEVGRASIRFLLAGRGTAAFQARLDRSIRGAGVADRIHVLGHRDDIGRWLPAMDALAVPSVDEPFGRMIVEGMHAGLPVVAFESGAVGEIVEDGRTGLLVPEGDVGALASALEGLAVDPARARRLGLAGRAAASRYAPATVAREMESLYERVVRG